jgi:hypothetical protein
MGQMGFSTAGTSIREATSLSTSNLAHYPHTALMFCIGILGVSGRS